MATTDVELSRALRELPGWQRHGDSIKKTFQFDDFAAAKRGSSAGWPSTPLRPVASPPSASAAAPSP